MGGGDAVGLEYMSVNPLQLETNDKYLGTDAMVLKPYWPYWLSINLLDQFHTEILQL